jgi:hypothetical protein
VKTFTFTSGSVCGGGGKENENPLPVSKASKFIVEWGLKGTVS